MSAETTLKLLLLGEDRSASKAVKGLGTETEKTGSQIGKFAGAAAGALAAIGVAKFAKDSIDKFGEVAGETAKLQRYIGGTAEDASRLRFAAQQSGIGIDDLTGGLGKMSKAMAGGNKAFTDLGVSVKDNNGKMKDVNTVFLETSDRISKMPAGAKKTADILALFGKTGMSLGPMLNKGADGIKNLEKQSDKLGLTMSGKDLAATKANTVAKRQFHAAIDGLQVTLGRALLPVMNVIAQVMTHLTPIIAAIGPTVGGVTKFVKDNALAFGIGAAAVGLIAAATAAHTIVLAINSGALSAWLVQTKIVQVATKAWAAVQWVLNAAMSANPIALVVIAVVALIAIFVLAWKHSETFRSIVTGAFNAVKNVVMGVINWIRNNWPLLLAILTGPVGLAVLFITKHFDQIVGFVTGLPKRIASAASGMWNGVKDAFRGAINWIIGAWNSLQFSIHIPKVHIPGTNSNLGGGDIGFGVPTIPMLKYGGIATSPTLAMLAEAGHPEAIVPLNRAKDFGFGGGDIHIHVNGQVYGTTQDLARVVLNGMQSLKHSGVRLGLA